MDGADEIDEDAQELIRARLDEGLSDLERQEIVSLLVKRITIHTDKVEAGKTQARAVIEHRFPKTVVQNCTGLGLVLRASPAKVWDNVTRHVEDVFGIRCSL